MTSRMLLETAGGALGLLLYFYLFLTLLGHRRERLRLALLLLTGALMLWFGGNAAAHLLGGRAPGMVRPLLAAAYTGLSLLLPLIPWAHWLYFRRHFHPTPWHTTALYISLALLALGALWMASGLPRLLEAPPEAIPWPAFRGLMLPFLLLMAVSYLHSAYFQLRIKRVVPQGAERRLMAWLPALFIFLPAFNLLAYPWEWWGGSAMQAWLFSLAKLGALVPGVLVAYFVFRHRFLQLRSMEGPAAVLVSIAAVVLYLSAERVIDIALPESAAVFALFIRALLLAAVLLSFSAVARWTQQRLAAAVFEEKSRRMEKKLAEKSHMEDLGRMAASVAHNVKNPLSSMKTLMQLWGESDNLTEEQRREVSMMIAEVDRLSDTVTSLLRFSRLEKEGKRGPGSQQVELLGLLQKVAGLFRGDIASRQLSLTVAARPRDAGVSSNRGALEEVLGNLLGNAVEACKAGDEIALEAQVEHNRWWIRVRDNGRGIPSSIRPQLFEPFVSDKSKGTGLGLAIVKQQVERLGGRVELEPSQRGASFLLVFPEDGKHEDTDR